MRRVARSGGRRRSHFESLETRTLLNGLNGTYFNNPDFTGETVRRLDPTVNFEWGAGSPAAAIGADTFSARWTGQVATETSGTYTFYTGTNDGVRLWVNGQLLINKWVNQAYTEWSGSINLTAGQRYAIKMEFFEGTGNAAARLMWSGPGVAKQVIPSGRLFAEEPTTAVPAAPTGLTATATSPRRVLLKWNDVANETGYKVERRLDGTDDLDADRADRRRTSRSSPTRRWSRARRTSTASARSTPPATRPIRTPPPRRRRKTGRCPPRRPTCAWSKWGPGSSGSRGTTSPARPATASSAAATARRRGTSSARPARTSPRSWTTRNSTRASRTSTA